MLSADSRNGARPILARARIILKWSGYAFLALILAAGLLGHSVWVRLHHSLPKIDGTIALAKLSAAVDVLRDRYGIPHIFAESTAEAMFALGFVHAQDRLFQMDFARRIGQGRLAELLGPISLPADKFIRTFDLAGASQRSFARLPSATRAALEAYAAGVNAFLTWNTKPLPPEFTLLAYRPEAWRPEDSVLIIKLMALQLSGNAFGEIANAELMKALGPDALLPFIPDLHKPLPQLETLYDSAEMKTPHEGQAVMPDGSSNNWVVDGRWTASGKPLLASDPHLGLTIPSIWYLAHLDYGGRPYIGATLPGVPGIILGRNDRIAWGYTNTGGDVQDLYLERVNPQNPDEYLTPTGSAPFVIRDETIPVRFFGAKRFSVRATRHGPVLPLDLDPLSKVVPEGHVLALAWPSLWDDDGTMGAGQALMKAEDCAGFVHALKSYVAPMQNMLCADSSGHIALIAPGRVPIRSPENNTLGLVPAPGWKSDYDWIGYVPFDALPQAMDPEQGFIATANNRIVSDSYPHLISLEWETEERVRRIEALIQADHAHTVASFAAMQMDQVSLFAREVLPSMIAMLSSPPFEPEAKAALQLLSAWDGTMAAERPEPLIFMAWLHTLTRALIADELGDELFSFFVGPSKSLLRKLVEGDPIVVRWCDDKTTPDVESCAAILSESFARAARELIAQQGPKPSHWQWGRAHEARFSHRLGAFPLFGRKLVRRIETGGGMDTIDRGQMYFRSDHPFANVHGAGYRAIYDLNDPEASLFIISTGQSGNPLSPHYDDLIEAWAYGTYLPMTTRRETLEKDGVSLLRLVPLGQSAEAKP